MKKVKVCIIGHFGFGKVLLNGQTVKTKIITKELVDQFGNDSVKMIDTKGGAKALPKLFLQVGGAMRQSHNMIMLPAHNGLKFFAPALYFWKMLFRNKIHYVVIGGWLPDITKSRRFLRHILKRFNAIYVETEMMKRRLSEQGFDNIIVMPNCKELHILNKDELVYAVPDNTNIIRLCTFSRVLKEKGIEDAIKAVDIVNLKYNRNVISLDIYGQIDDRYKDEFLNLMQGQTDSIKYCGEVDYEKSVEVLKNYYALVFPTYYEGEGFAGTLIDAMAAGIPVIASDWKYNTEIVKESVTGFIYENRNVVELARVLETACKEINLCNEMKKTCLEQARQYQPSNVIKILIENLG